MSEPDPCEECGNPEGDGCVVNYAGGREYWCKYAYQNTVEVKPDGVYIFCSVLGRVIKVIDNSD